MKKILSCFAITLLLFACSKTESILPLEDEFNPELELKAGMTIITNDATFITSATATCGGDIQTSGGGGSVIERGICYRTKPTPKITHKKVPSGSGNGSFTSILSGLKGDKVYYARAYVIKSNGKVKYGNEISFTTLPDIGTLTDADGNVYTTININNQVWTVENLKTTTYRDGMPILNVIDGNEWASLSSGAYCDYNNDVANVATYGRLYNWYAVTDEHNIAPEGWHVASRYEMLALLDYLGGWYPSGGNLKEAGFEHWQSPNTGAVNSTGFTALPGGYRMVVPNTLTSSFSQITGQGRFWASYISGGANADYFYMQQQATSVMGSFTSDGIGPWFNPYNKCNGYSVRLVKD